jgi:16S rRNA (cytosine1402-N4)-methyltransferase
VVPAHTPVMLEEALGWLAPRPGGVYCDLTLGLGGHAEAILAASAPDGRLVGVDRDATALARAGARLAPFAARVTLIHGAFSEARALLEACGARPCDGLLCDLGVSSPQLDEPERGFSFRADGPLDMRMDQSRGPTALELLHDMGRPELERVLREYGEERYAGRIARVILEAVGRDALRTTGDLAALVAGAVPTRERHKDPATRTFQALRLLVNDELGELDQLLADLPDLVAPGGRVVFIAFHSLEDRRVKLRLRELAARPAPRFRRLTHKAARPGAAELAQNPRARSARLRAAERCA